MKTHCHKSINQINTDEKQIFLMKHLNSPSESLKEIPEAAGAQSCKAECVADQCSSWYFLTF